MANRKFKNVTKVIPKVHKPGIDFGFNFPKYYMGGSFLSTHMSNALHMIFPDGERFFIRSVMHYFDQIDDPELKARVKAFVGQEGVHGNEHQKFWDTLKDQGFDTEPFLNFMNRYLWKNDEGPSLEETMMKIFGPKMALSATIALEHFTAMMSEAMFTNGVDVADFVHGDMANLMKWHAAEELEHKSVAFDVYEHVAGDYFTRALGFILAGALLPVFITIGTATFIIQDDEKGKIFEPQSVLGFFGALANWGRVFATDIPAYFRPGFHPDEKDNYHLASETFAEFDKKRSATG